MTVVFFTGTSSKQKNFREIIHQNTAVQRTFAQIQSAADPMCCVCPQWIIRPFDQQDFLKRQKEDHLEDCEAPSRILRFLPLMESWRRTVRSPQNPRDFGGSKKGSGLAANVKLELWMTRCWRNLPNPVKWPESTRLAWFEDIWSMRSVDNPLWTI